MADLDYAALQRALNAVRLNGQALIAARTADAHADEALRAAEDLSRFELFAGSTYNRGATVKRLSNLKAGVARASLPLAGTTTAGARVSGPAWTSLQKAIQLLYVEIAGTYGALSADEVTGSMLGDLGNAIVAYGDEVAKEGVIGGAGKIIGDTAKAIGRGAANVTRGVTQGTADIADAAAGGVSSILGGILAKGWPVLIGAAIVLALFVFGKKKLTGGLL
jgi:hypothetical protein